MAVGVLMLWPNDDACGQAAAGAAEDGQIVILNNDSQLRGYLVFRTPVVMTAEGQLQTALDPMAKEPKPLPEYQSALPPADWRKPGFDDSAWDRQNAPIELAAGGATGRSHAARHTATVNSMICVRAKVGVTDPSKAADLKLSLEYVGGAIVYLNGQEIARSHMPAGEVTPETLAEKYPDDLYCEPNNLYLQDVQKNPEGFNRRYRRLQANLPGALLRQGSNVLAIEIHRAPINEAAVKATRVPVGGMYTIPGLWAYAGLQSLRLTCGSADGVTANVARPKGVQVWNVAPFETIDAFSYGDPGETLHPITIHAARNSVFSGRLAVSSDQAISGLKVAVSDLKQADGGGVLPASAVRVRCAQPADPRNSWAPSHRLDGLLDAVPAQVAVINASQPRGSQSKRTSGAVASLWFTVRTPADAKPGTYEGTVSVEAAGLPAVRVPLRVNVNGWTLPAPKDFRQHHLICVSPESVARHYDVPLWSDRHMELMGKSLALLAEVNSREIPLNLAIDFYGAQSNRETMVRWIRQADGSYSHDFSPFDKYLDLVAKQVGKPFPVRLNCWGELGQDGQNGAAGSVSRLDPATGRVEPMPQPPFGSEESCQFWKPVIDAALQKLQARGWLDVAAFGHNSYCYPVKPQVVDVARKLWPEGGWAYTAHNGQLGMRFPSSEKGAAMPVKWAACVWTEGQLRRSGYGALLESRPSIWCTLARTRHWDRSPLEVVRNLAEEALLRGHDGLADFGAENFPIENPQAKGRFFNLGAGRGTGGGNNASTRALLAAGPDGPVASERFEMFREGTQLGEAILYLEQALKDTKIGGELGQTIRRFLDQRSETFIRDWYERGTGFINQWSIAGQFQSDARLLELAAEVAAAKAD